MRHLFCFLLLLALSCNTAHTRELLLTNGDLLSGNVVEEDPQQVVLDHPLLGRLLIDRSKIVAITDQHTPVEVGGPGSQLSPSTREPAMLPAQGDSINQRIEFGLSGASGNSRNSDFRLGYQRRNQSVQRYSVFKSSYRRQSSDGKTEENDFFTELTYDWLMPNSRWFRFAQGRYDWDDFEDWHSRVSGSGGSGYIFVDHADLRIAGRLGLGLTQTYGGEDDELDPEGIVGFDSHWQINDRQTLELTNTLYLQLDEFGELRNLTSLAWLIKLDQFSGLDLKLGVDNEYESISAGDSRSNDLKYDLSLTWELK